MRIRWAVLVWLSFAFSLRLAPVVAEAHPGGLNSSGCHTNRKTGDYHCHGAPSRSTYTPTPRSAPWPTYSKPKTKPKPKPKSTSARRASHKSSSSREPIKRSRAAVAAFRRAHPCPVTGRTTGACPGWEVDHIKPLACGGPDTPENMQWLTAKQNRKKGAKECRRR